MGKRTRTKTSELADMSATTEGVDRSHSQLQEAR